jgi:serine O-acetyltransferase
VIQSKEDYLYYLEADRQSLDQPENKKRPSLFGDEVWKFERLLRRVEYYKNCRKDFFSRVYLLYLKWKFHNLSIKLGYHIEPNVCGPGLALHWHLVGIHGAAKIGANCLIQSGVNIGTKAGEGSHVPKIGNNVYIGPGVKIFGDITIADNIAIGANAVVNKSFLEPGISIGGIPAKKISNKGSEGLLTRGTELADAHSKYRKSH